MWRIHNIKYIKNFFFLPLRVGGVPLEFGSSPKAKGETLLYLILFYFIFFYQRIISFTKLKLKSISYWHSHNPLYNYYSEPYYSEPMPRNYACITKGDYLKLSIFFLCTTGLMSHYFVADFFFFSDSISFSVTDPKLTLGRSLVLPCSEKHPKAIHLDYRCRTY